MDQAVLHVLVGNLDLAELLSLASTSKATRQAINRELQRGDIDAVGGLATELHLANLQQSLVRCECCRVAVPVCDTRRCSACGFLFARECLGSYTEESLCQKCGFCCICLSVIDWPSVVHCGHCALMFCERCCAEHTHLT